MVYIKIMEYSVHKLAKISGVSVRALHYYDEMGLLNPKRMKWNNYRVYSEEDLLLLQQIIFYKELDFPLDEIKKIIGNKNFDFIKALNSHKQEIIKKRKRIDEVLKTIDKTILKITKNKKMKDDELFDSLIEKHEKEYAKEAEQKWGSAEAYKQSKDRVAKMSKEDMKKVLEKQTEVANAIASCMKEGVGVSSGKVQSLVREHYNDLRAFYEPNKKMYLGLAQMYVDDPRFKKHYDDIEQGLAQYLSDSMKVFTKSMKV